MRHLTSLFLVGSLAAVLCADVPVTPVVPVAPVAVDSQPTKAPVRPLLAEVAFVGASATAGFGVLAKVENHSPPIVSVPLAASFAGAVTSQMTTHDLGAPLFFMSPGSTGKSLVDRALTKDPTLVIGVDYLFWYVYGDDDGRGHQLKSEASRLEKLELGFRELERFAPEIPIIVGDIPDMSRTVGKMIGPSQMPATATLKLANEHILAWVAKREHTTLFPLSKLVDDLKSDHPISAGGITFMNDKGKLIQSDDLHPTLRGSLALALTLADLIKNHVAEKSEITTANDEATAVKRLTDAAVAIYERRAGKTEQLAPQKP